MCDLPSVRWIFFLFNCCRVINLTTKKWSKTWIVFWIILVCYRFYTVQFKCVRYWSSWEFRPNQFKEKACLQGLQYMVLLHINATTLWSKIIRHFIVIRYSLCPNKMVGRFMVIEVEESLRNNSSDQNNLLHSTFR